MIGIKFQAPIPLREIVFLAQYAESRGLDSVWTTEYQRDGAVAMGALAAGTERVIVGSSLLPIYTRSPVVLAMTAAAVAELAPGRVVLGLGSSTPVIIEEWHGSARNTPLDALHENVNAIRSVLRGEKSDIDGKAVHSHGFRLEWEQLQQPELPIYVGALGEQAIKRASTYADGLLLNATPSTYLGAIRAAVDSVPIERSRSRRVQLAGDVRVGVGAGQRIARLRERQRKAMASYARGPQYRRFFAGAGFPAEAAAMDAAWKAHDQPAAIAAMTDEMLDTIVAIGEEDAVKARLEAVLAAGLNHLIVYPLWDADESPGDAIRHIITVVSELAGC